MVGTVEGNYLALAEDEHIRPCPFAVAELRNAGEPFLIGLDEIGRGGGPAREVSGIVDRACEILRLELGDLLKEVQLVDKAFLHLLRRLFAGSDSFYVDILVLEGETEQVAAQVYRSLVVECGDEIGIVSKEAREPAAVRAYEYHEPVEDLVLCETSEYRDKIAAAA